MNEFSTTTSSVAPTGIEELRAEVQSLRTVISFALVLVFIFSVCVNIFLMRQVSAINLQANQATTLVFDWSKDGPNQKGILEFWAKLNEFTKTHPDFAPILNKYSGFFSHSNGSAPTPAPKKK